MMEFILWAIITPVITIKSIVITEKDHDYWKNCNN